MFGLSLSKLLLLALVIGAVWYGYKWLNRAKAAQDGAARKSPSAPRGEDLTACPACGTFVPEGLKNCPSDRPDCPAVAK